MQTGYFGNFGYYWLYPPKLTVSTWKNNFTTHFFLEISQRLCKLDILGTIGMSGHTHQKLCQLIENLNIYQEAKNQLHPSLLFWDITKILQTYYFGYFEHVWPWPPKLIVINLYQSLMFICMKQINFIPPFFFEILQRYHKLVILGTLGILGYGHQKQWYKVVENFNVYFHAKFKFIPHLFLGMLLRYCTPFMLGTLDMPDHSHKTKIVSTSKKLWCLSTYKNQLDPSVLCWDITFQRILQSDGPRAFWSIP